jgi:hypothetical protein
MPSVSILGGISQDASIQEMLATQTLILEAILAKLPRADANGKGFVSLAENTLGTIPTITTVGTVSAITAGTITSVNSLGASLRPLDGTPMHLGNAGSMHLYNQILIS